MILDEVNAAVFAFMKLGVRGPAVLEIRRTEFERLRNELCELRGDFDAMSQGVRIADSEELVFHTPIGDVTVQSRPDEILGVPRFVLIERGSGRQHGIMDIQVRAKPPEPQPAPAPAYSGADADADADPSKRVLH